MIPSAIATQTANLMPAFVNVCAQLAPPLSIAVCAAPMPTIRNIKSNEDVGSLPLLPYSCMTANGWYVLP